MKVENLTVNSTNTQVGDYNIQINDGLAAQLRNSAAKVPKYMPAYALISEAADLAEKNNEKGLITYLKKHRNEFVSGSIQGILGSTLGSIILKLIQVV